MLWQEWKAGELGGVPLHILVPGCVCFFLALRVFAAPSSSDNLLATPGNVKATVTCSAVTDTTGYNVSIIPVTSSAGEAAAVSDREAGLAHQVSPRERNQEAQRSSQAVTEPPGHLASWKVTGDPVTVIGEAPLREEDLIGSYRQPRWTARRRFGETRVYVIPKGDVEFEYWLVPALRRDGEETEIEQQIEVEIGLPRRFQLDLYAVTHKEGNTGTLAVDETKLEVRWAFADWGRLWGNPAVYLEWKALSDEPDHVEAKLLLGGQVTQGLHWGANLVFEHEMGGDQTNARELTAGLSHTVRDEKVSVGAEVKLAWEDIQGDRGSYQREYLLGPSFQIRPLPQAHFDVVLLAGLNEDAPRAKGIFIFGWEL